ncbi:mating-type protein MAT alpha 1, partial [Aspergillus nomiae NRRL 13137]
LTSIPGFRGFRQDGNHNVSPPACVQRILDDHATRAVGGAAQVPPGRKSSGKFSVFISERKISILLGVQGRQKSWIYHLRVLTHGPQFRGGSEPQMQNEGRSIVSLPLEKAKSGILRFLWQNDPFKAKWAILAKAYSIIRDDHDSDVSLESFLGLNAQFIGIIGPSRYLEVMGWQLDVDDQQQYTIARVKATTANEADISTNYSVNDIVKHCYTSGYPTLVVHKDDSIRISGNHTIVTDVCKTNPAMEISSPEQTEDTFSPNTSDLSTIADEPPLDAMEVVGICSRPQLFPESSTANGFDLDNIHFPGWNEENAMFTYDAALHTPLMPYDPLHYDPLDGYDFSRFVDI